jgi:hypothetical protein
MEVRKVKFWGGPKFHDNGSVYRDFDPSEPRYTGDPTKEMDEAWENLTKGRFLFTYFTP